MSLVVGLTGGIASGKSTVSNMLKEMNITVIDADVESRLAVQKGEPAYRKIIAEFGREILLENGEIDRAALGSIIFHQEEKRLLLNQIVHPEVRRRMNEKVKQAKLHHEEIIVLDIPLLFESNLTYMADKTLLVYVDEEIQLKRLMERNHLSAAEAEARIQSQMPLSAKLTLADAVINNNGTLRETKRQLMKILADWGIHKE
ncbi:dephospho-CoA kinase [Neobacillus sp. OS1-32]|jgi:dephospho-CoA kinase|uniref:Dephospho-CoA kinase n=1 Tax=Neobacillus paridis TaxID=2803862 RepID=A0ABS1TIL1_9BACI|nr:MULTISPECIES: dephospho-CoA kinase [Neobacillus]MBL4951159.1 dephospho-CoA kinase [Neobacillus paridis]WML30481.1 dephospho-CoA kinase [Neobacillus sp. OS1-32]